MKNHEVARILRNISILLDMDSVPFKPRAYEKAALTIEALEEDVEQMEAQQRKQNIALNRVGGEPEARKPATRDEDKIGRNDNCPCGSGKKYKKCCGK